MDRKWLEKVVCIEISGAQGRTLATNHPEENKVTEKWLVVRAVSLKKHGVFSMSRADTRQRHSQCKRLGCERDS